MPPLVRDKQLAKEKKRPRLRRWGFYGPFVEAWQEGAHGIKKPLPVTQHPEGVLPYAPPGNQPIRRA